MWITLEGFGGMGIEERCGRGTVSWITLHVKVKWEGLYKCF